MNQGCKRTMSMRRAGEESSPARPYGAFILGWGLLAAGMLVGGCTSESAGGGSAATSVSANHPPVIRQASLSPDPLRLDGPVSVQIQADDPDRDPLTFHYQWVVNGQPLAGWTDSTLPPTVLKQGNAVSVEVVPDDGKVRGVAVQTAALTVVNTPPVISDVFVRPQPALPGDRLEARVEVADPDGDRIDLVFRWLRNGVVVKEGDEPVLDTSGFAPKDLVIVEVIPRDRTALGKPVKSGPLLAINSPPAIVSTPSVPAGRDRYDYAVKAVDPEGDRLIYRLETAPPGMTIDAETGHVQWSVAPTVAGTHHVRIVVQDVGGGTAFQEFDLSVPPPPPLKPEGA